MDLFGSIERLINEHGSASILKERLDFLKEKFALLEKENSMLKHENSVFKTQNSELKSKVSQLEVQINNFKNSSEKCDHCGGPSLVRGRAVLDPTLGDLGVKNVSYSCKDCGGVTWVQQVPN